MSFDSRVSFNAARAFVVADDQPGRMTVGQCRGVHRTAGAHRRVQRERIVTVVCPPRGQRPFDSLARLSS